MAPRKPQSVPLAALAAWSKPGLCSSSADAAAARDTVTRSFRVWDGAERGKFYLDPRLPADAELPILSYLDQADNETSKRLGLRPARPVVFVYFDQQLMKAAACINDDAVAFYDGALHVVANRSDVLQSVLHEYTHHALFSSGMVGPAWAQEGIAMNIARENWWRTPQFLQALLSNPFDQEDMDRSIPYKLSPQQAVAFYVQSAALVECVLRKRNWELKQLFVALQAGTDLGAGTLSYDLPELAQSSFLRDCLAN
ncbi:MAG TPA: translation initiation factor IF-2 [Polyangiaceae bacterium]